MILLLMIGMSAGALNAYQKRGLLVQAALLSEGFNLSSSVKSAVLDHFVRHGVLPDNNQDANVPPAKSIFGTSVKQVGIAAGGNVIVEFDGEPGKQSMRFAPTISSSNRQISWRCTSSTIDANVLALLRPACFEGTGHTIVELGAAAKPSASGISSEPQLRGAETLSEAFAPIDVEDGVQLRGLYSELTWAASDCHAQRLQTLLIKAGELEKPELVNGMPLTSVTVKPGCIMLLQDFIRTKPVYRKALNARFASAVAACDTKAVDSLLHSDPDIVLFNRVGLQSHFERTIASGCASMLAFFARENQLSGHLPDNTILWTVRNAPQYKLIELIGVLIAAGANVNALDESGQSAVAAAIALEQPVVAKYLVDAGADASAKTGNSSYPLIESAKKGYNHLAIQLLRMGAEADRQDNFGRTALLAAVANGHKRLVRTLLDAGADPRLKDRNGIDAVMLAETRNYQKIHRWLTAPTIVGSL